MMMRRDARLFVVLAALPLVLAIGGTALAEEVTSLPIGHLKVTVGENGKINVEARCVPTKDIINEIAKQTGRTVVYDCDVQTFGSVYRPNSWTDAEWWASTPTVSPHAEIEEEGGIWHLKADIVSDYDPALTDAQIVESCTTSVQPVTPAKGAEGTLDTGILVYNGHYIPGPYKVETVAPDASHINVTINGLVMASHDSPSSVPKAAKPLPVLPESGQFDDYASLQNYVSYVLFPQLVDEYGSNSAREKVNDFLKTQRIVKRILSDEELTHIGFPTNFWVMLNSDGPEIPYNILIAGLDPQTGRLLEEYRMDSLTTEEKLGMHLESLRQSLERPELILIEEGHVQINISDLHELTRLTDVVANGQALSITQAECLIADVVEDHHAARDLAIGLRGESDAFVNRLRAMCTELENQKIEAGILPTPGVNY